MKITIVFRFSAMGDVAIAASVMREIAAQNSDTHFVIVTRAFFSPFFDNIPNVEVFPVDFSGKYKGFWGILRLYKALNKTYNIGFIADLHDVLRTQLLTLFFRLSRKKIKIATIHKGRKEKRVLCNIKMQKTQLKSTWLRYTEVFQALQIKAEIKPVNIPYLPEKVRKIGISPFAQHKGKVYPHELTERVLELLHPQYEIYLFGGGKKEQEICEKWQEKFTKVQSLVGKYSLAEELKFISNLDVMLSMDSACMHLASLCNVPCVSIWGATHPYVGFVGFRQELNPQIQLEELPCRPCSVYGNKSCRFGDYRCLYGIEPDEVVQKLLGKN